MRISGLIIFSILVTFTQLSARAEEQHAILNAIHSDEVRHIMRRLNILLFDRERTHLELQRLRSQQLELLVEETELLAKTASNPSTIDSLDKLDDEQQLTFRAMAKQLHEITIKLQKKSAANHKQAVDEAYIELQETCNTCHLLFRTW